MGASEFRSFVFAVEFEVGDADRVWPVLTRYEESLRDLGALYAFIYESIIGPSRVLVVIGVRTRQPLVSLLRSPQLFEWFDAVGLDDLPAVFAGETVERFDIGDPPAPGTEIVVAAITPVDDVDEFLAWVRESLSQFARAGIRRTLVYRAFDTPREVMFLQQLANPEKALLWVEHSELAASWLAAAGVGAYPPVFVGRFVNAMRLAQTSGTDLY
ncbi:fatty-acid--CoA ligase [Mycobacterium sp. NPDC051804]|uniref:fatty-acid--CoA ligase n=1 Tax=Mycobacterium sp. NPDC051804 TaxID=3364295 RepID=UPI0037AA5118